MQPAGRNPNSYLRPGKVPRLSDANGQIIGPGANRLADHDQLSYVISVVVRNQQGFRQERMAWMSVRDMGEQERRCH